MAPSILISVVHPASPDASQLSAASKSKKQGEVKPTVNDDVEAPDGSGGHVDADYMARAQWLRAAVLGANDGLVSVASLMIGVGAVNEGARAMLVSGLAGLVAGACSMAFGEFVSVYAQYDIQVAHAQRNGGGEEEEEGLPSPTKAAAASALASGWFVRPWAARVAAVFAATSLGLAGFGAAGAYLRARRRVARHGRHVRGAQAVQLGVQHQRFAGINHSLSISIYVNKRSNEGLVSRHRRGC
jgi:vacuolar iron transporter family protein